jgi:hypothetical protein
MIKQDELNSLFAEAMLKSVVAHFSSAPFDKRILRKIFVMVWIQGIIAFADFLLRCSSGFLDRRCHIV